MKRKNVLVTGGAGYIGSHALSQLSKAGFVPICFDNLSTGWRDAIQNVIFEHGDLRDQKRVKSVLSKYDPIAVMHFAGLSQVGESIIRPREYWENNVVGSFNLLGACADIGCENVIFSSTCATYGDQDGVILTENSVQSPLNPYARTKLSVEHLLRDFALTERLRYVIFRYFNVAGADPNGKIGEFHRPETHLIPLIFDCVLGKRSHLEVYGADYDTPDGTCVRDYIHVNDLVDAHIKGLEWLLDGNTNEVFNLGTGNGYSVLDVIKQTELTTNSTLNVRQVGRRPGDAGKLVSGSTKAKMLLNWETTRSDLKTIISDGWKWHSTGRYEI